MDKDAVKLAAEIQSLINTWMQANPGKWVWFDISKDVAGIKPEPVTTVRINWAVDDL